MSVQSWPNQSNFSALADSICGKSTSYLLVLLNLEAVRTTEEQPGKFWFTYINVIVRFFLFLVLFSLPSSYCSEDQEIICDGKWFTFQQFTLTAPLFFLSFLIISCTSDKLEEVYREKQVFKFTTVVIRGGRKCATKSSGKRSQWFWFNP